MSIMDSILNDLNTISQPIQDSASDYLKDSLGNIIDTSALSEVNEQFASLKNLLPNTTEAVTKEATQIVRETLQNKTTPEMSNVSNSTPSDSGQTITKPSVISNVLNKTVDVVKSNGNFLLILGAGILVYYIYTHKGRRL